MSGAVVPPDWLEPLHSVKFTNPVDDIHTPVQHIVQIWDACWSDYTAICGRKNHNRKPHKPKWHCIFT